MMHAGKLRHSVMLQSPSGSRDAVGERDTVWSTVATVRADIMPVKAQDRFIDPQTRSSITHKVRVRYGSEIETIDHSWRVQIGARVFTINGVRDIQERHRVFELLCTEGLRPDVLHVRTTEDGEGRTSEDGEAREVE